MSEPIERLIEAAKAAREFAYAPYSGYKVGAAVEDERGHIFSGCNVENASYGASICAERAAIFRLIAEGGREIRAAAVSTDDGGVPCGMCLQVFSEFAPDPSSVTISCVDSINAVKSYSLHEMHPFAFRLSNERK